jgi:hypothetical protein
MTLSSAVLGKAQLQDVDIRGEVQTGDCEVPQVRQAHQEETQRGRHAGLVITGGCLTEDLKKIGSIHVLYNMASSEVPEVPENRVPSLL